MSTSKNNPNETVTAKTKWIKHTGKINPVKTKSHGSYTYHTVTNGETIFSLAKRYHTSASKIRSLNNLRSNQIKVGQTLKFSSAKTLQNPTTATYKKTSNKNHVTTSVNHSGEGKPKTIPYKSTKKIAGKNKTSNKKNHKR